MKKTSCEVIAVVMDVFTDSDIFLDLYEAATRRMVPVYIIISLHHLSSFLQMVETLAVNVRFIENMRIRILSGCTFNTRHLKQVTGILKEKFLLVDGESVITGTYSFTWSDSRLERNIITLLTGEVTDSFDNEFRTLFAASRPLQRYDFAKDFHKDINNRTPIPSLAISVPREPEFVNHICQPEERITEINGFSSPEKFNTSGMMQPAETPAPIISPLIGVPLSKSVNKIAERRSVVPAMEKNIGRNPGFNHKLGVPDSLRMAKETVNVPDYSIRHRLAACRNFEGSTANLRGGQESHSALSDILKNVQRSRLSVAKTTGGRPSKSLWDLSRLSQLSGCSGDQNLRQNPLEPGDENKNKSRWMSKDTPAMLLMRQRAYPNEDSRVREPVNSVASGFKPSAVISPVRLQGQLVHNMNASAVPRQWVSPSRHIRPRYF
ncbi:Hypothetical predicted protein [Pelobates cultripes]|uniref:Scaffolding anchor of CK1 domain-containing protein n=2 Tax=Pelobates cultripes TaxID=61616 RepID=A0AAD1T5Q1_PELCU|nr:Hypothetical predicted protein [Pelobates cultripes]